MRLTLDAAPAESLSVIQAGPPRVPVLVDIAQRIGVPAIAVDGDAGEGSRPTAVGAVGAALAEAGVDHEIVIYADVPHSFFDRRAGEFAAEAADAWTRVPAFIGARSSDATAKQWLPREQTGGME